MKLAVDFTWEDAGSVGLVAGMLRFPSVPELPGVYRFTFPDRSYVGQTDRLRRRFQHYRTPGPSQATNMRLNAAIAAALDAGGAVAVAVILQATLHVDGRASGLDLRHKPARLLLENAALTAAHVAGEWVENL